MEPREYERSFALDQVHWWFRAKRALVQTLLRRHGAPTVGHGLDVGCGTGGILATLAGPMPDWTWIGVDAEPRALTLAARRGLRLAGGSASELPFGPATFDAVLCLDVLYHRRVTSESAALAECFRVLRPGGLLVVTDSAFAWLRSAHDRAVHGARRYTRAEMVDLLQGVGFRRVWDSYAYGLLFPATMVFRLLGRLTRQNADRGSDLFPVPRPLNRALELVQAAERGWLRMASLPFGSSVVCVARKEEAAEPVPLPRPGRPMATSVVLPTYNEREVVVRVVQEVLAALPEAEVLVVDDDSPDRTWEVVERAFAGHARVRVLRRQGRRGLATALAEGVNGTTGEVVIWLDADGSMPAEALPRLRDALAGADVAVASRYAPGGHDGRSSSMRTLASRAINGFGTAVLGGTVRDWTSGFVAVRRGALGRVPMETGHVHGEYCIAFLYHGKRAGLRVVEVPYHCQDRWAGKTKTSPDLRHFVRLGIHYAVTIVRLRRTDWEGDPAHGRKAASA